MINLFTGCNLIGSRGRMAVLLLGLLMGAGCAKRNAVVSLRESDKSTFIRDRIKHFSDGDSMTLTHFGKVRLAGVDCPELHQTGGRDAAAFTKHELQNREVEIEICKEDPKDQYGRSLVFLYYNDHAGKRHLFNTQLLAEGFARVYENTPCLNGRREEWEADYESARQNRRGLFRSNGGVPDGKVYRRNHSR